MNTAWAVGALLGPSLGGALAESQGDAAPYLVGAALCALTLARDASASRGEDEAA